MDLFQRFLRDEGFTLIEMLVVIIVIGLLLAIALPTFLGQQDKGNDAGARGYINTAYKTLKAAQVEDGQFEFTGNEAIAAVSDSEGNAFISQTVGVQAVSPQRVWIISPAAAVSSSSIEIGGFSTGRTCTGIATSSGIDLSAACSG